MWAEKRQNEHGMFWNNRICVRVEGSVGTAMGTGWRTAVVLGVWVQQEESMGWGTGVNWKDRGPQEAEREIKMTQHPVPTAQPGVSLGPDHLGMCPPHLGREKGKLGWL